MSLLLRFVQIELHHPSRPFHLNASTIVLAGPDLVLVEIRHQSHGGASVSIEEKSPYCADRTIFNDLPFENKLHVRKPIPDDLIIDLRDHLLPKPKASVDIIPSA